MTTFAKPVFSIQPRLRQALPAALAGLALAACAWPAQAQLTSIGLFVNQGPAGGQNTQGSGPISASLSSPSTRPAGFGEGHAAAQVDFGLIRLTASAPEGVSTGDARGSFTDFFSITDPGVPNGTFGVATFQIAVTGLLTAERNARADWSLDIRTGTSRPFAPLAGTLFHTGLYTGDPFGTYSGSFRFQFGRSERLNVEATCSASAARSGTPLVIGSSACDMGNSITWGGITSIVPEGGFTLSGVTLTSDSGTNYLLPYTAPVPEPATWVLMAGSLALWLARARGRRARPAA
jgi:hypothetical protein